MDRSEARRWLGAGLSLAAHGAALLALLSLAPEPTPAFEPEPMLVTLVAPRPLSPAPTPPAPDPAPAPAKTPPRPKAALKPTPAPRPHPTPLAAREAPAEDVAIELSAAQLAGAASVGAGEGDGAGAGGGDCDMLRFLQAQLRKDPKVQAAMAQAHQGKPVLVWNGGWVRHPGQEGGGLAQVREALMWEIAYAPEACRSKPVRGLVLISLHDRPGAPRLVLGQGQWRWTDLLMARRGG